MRNACRLFVPSCVLLLSTVYVAEAMQPVTIGGWIHFTGEHWPAMVRVQLRGIGQPAVEHYFREGRFAFEDVNPGPYEISFQAAGYEASTETITIHGNEEFVFQLHSSSPLAQPRVSTLSAEARPVLDYRIPGSARKELETAKKQREKRKCDDAIVHLRKAVEIFPQYADAHAEMGRCHADLNDWDSASHDLKRSLDIRPSIVVALNLVDVYLVQDRDGDAENLLRLSIDPYLQGHRERELLQQFRLYLRQSRPGAFSDRIRNMLQNQ